MIPGIWWHFCCGLFLLSGWRVTFPENSEDKEGENVGEGNHTHHLVIVGHNNQSVDLKKIPGVIPVIIFNLVYQQVYTYWWRGVKVACKGEVQKEVHMEYLTWTGISMVGNIGGQLGLWIGFSFTSLVAVALNMLPTIRAFIKRILVTGSS